jgi:ribose transport system substrate-binding protein
MVLAPFSNTGFGGVIRPLMKKGIPVTLSGQAVEPPDGLTTYISNFLKGGNSLAKEVGKLTGGTGTMAIVADSTGNKTDSDRYTGLVPILKKKYPHLKIVGPQYASNSTAKAASVTASLIVGNRDLKLVYASSGPEAVGAASAIAAAHKSGKIKLISFDSSPPQIELLKQGKLAATIGQSPFLTGKLTVTSVVKYLRTHKNGGPVKSSAKLSYTPTVLLTPKNVNTKLGKQYQYLTKC